MAIGSQPEVGATFKSCQDYTMTDWENWWAWMRTNWTPTLLTGYALLVHDTNNPYYRKKDNAQKTT